MKNIWVCLVFAAHASFVAFRAGIGGHLLLQGALGLEDDSREVVQSDQAGGQGGMMGKLAVKLIPLALLG
jgi:hypothetical protein